jgi:type I restriction enzyme S subunit
MYSPVKISEFLHRKKQPVKINPTEEYSLVTVKLHHKGVVLREKKRGSLLGSNMYKVSKGQFILSGIDARNGAFGVVPDELDGAIVTNDFWYFDVDENKVKRDFFYWLTNTPLFLDACEKSSKGETQRIRLQKNLFYDFEFHFPPVDKQEEFLNQINDVDSSLSLLRTEQEKQTSYITLVRQAILEEAIEGKLTADWRKKNPKLISGENHASKLLEKIKSEKERLIKEGKIKKDKPLPPIPDAETPFDLPKGWVWSRIGDIVLHNSGKTLDNGRNKGVPRKYITTSNLYWGYFVLNDLREMLIEDNELDRCTAIKGDLLICEGGEAGRASVWEYDYDICFQNHIHRIRPYCKINPYYIFRYFQKLNFTGEINKHRKGMGISNLSGKSLSLIEIPLPPLAEQRAIVERVGKLMAMIDELEKQVTERKDKSERLMQSVLREAFESKA